MKEKRFSETSLSWSDHLYDWNTTLIDSHILERYWKVLKVSKAFDMIHIARKIDPSAKQ